MPVGGGLYLHKSDVTLRDNTFVNCMLPADRQRLTASEV